MPEGPEIHLAADEIAGAIVGDIAQELFFAFDHLKPCQDQLSGQKIIAVQARGKAILVKFANGFNIYSHNQLYGKWLVRNVHNYPNTNRQLRLAIHTAKKSALLYSASDIEVLREDELDTHPYLSRLGPDLLDPTLSLEEVVDRFHHKAFYRRKLSSLLLDQHFLAGLGNYLRSEVLFVAGVHPSMRPADCTGVQVRKLATAAVDLSRQSYETKGITNDLDLAHKLREQGYSRSQYRFRVFNREGEPCYRCGAAIVKETIGGRRLYYCPLCQPFT